ncbi:MULTISPECIES: hypothetical protein [Lysinibacillus]|nr:hypothetical protein [Lysinibacillus sphaericus]
MAVGAKRSGGNRWRLGRSVAAATDGGWGESVAVATRCWSRRYYHWT